MKRLLFRLLFAGLAAATAAAGAASLQAHHPFSATYVPDRQITIDGTVVELAYRNPHAFIHLSALDRDGRTRRWAIEWGHPGTERRLGVPTDVLKIGDRLVVTGSPARDPGAFRILGRTIVRSSDGWRWAGQAL
jgi:hypothetical protein